MSALKLLIVDDEQPVLDALYRLFRKDYAVSCFTRPQDALDALRVSEFAVIISDMKMPIMSGAEFLQQALSLKPDTPRLLLTGFSDMEDTSKAINLGKISNYIAKPWQNIELKTIVGQAAEQYQLKQSVYCLERQLKEKNKLLQYNNKVLEQKVALRTAKLQKLATGLKKAQNQHRNMFQDVIEMINLIIEDVTDDNTGHVKRVASHCRLLAERMGLNKSTVTLCYLAGLMHEIGKVSLEDTLLNQIENDLGRADLQRKYAHAIKGAEILAKVPNLLSISISIKHQYEWFDGTGFPDHLAKDAIPIASRVLAIVNDYDKLLIGRTTGKEMSKEQALVHLSSYAKLRYDPEVFNAYIDTLALITDTQEYHLDSCTAVAFLEPGMILSRDLLSKQGTVLLTKDSELTENTIDKLKKFERDWNYIFNIFVH
ncbi:HD domain-containing phosphohydrolase [Algibacillus agarilyticus]|uniref:HD domain-containing phosphohydrolase n=1 Tax=Algibacillus agarilyticus TaxID=2234133 RepID=UPI000DD0D2C0|nr:HD domain-containing phosphohydrolase [Algibacillus agarilyticus]